MYERLWQHHWHCFILSMRVSPLFPAKTERVNVDYESHVVLTSLPGSAACSSSSSGLSLIKLASSAAYLVSRYYVDGV